MYMNHFMIIMIFNYLLQDDGEFQGSFIGEEKMMFGVHGHTVLQMTIAKIRKAYNKIDSKSIAKQVLILLNYIYCFLKYSSFLHQ